MSNELRAMAAQSRTLLQEMRHVLLVGFILSLLGALWVSVAYGRRSMDEMVAFVAVPLLLSYVCLRLLRSLASPAPQKIDTGESSATAQVRGLAGTLLLFCILTFTLALSGASYI